MPEDIMKELERLFYPRSIAVIGASQRGVGFGTGGNGVGFMEGPISLRFSGMVYPINPKAKTVLGYKAYPSVLDVPDDIDLAILAVHHKVALSVIKDCAVKGVKFAHLFTAGFSETGQEENAELEREMIRVAKAGGVRIIGPNCMGVYCPEGGVGWNKDFPQEPGPVGFVSQSGQLAGQFADTGGRAGLRYSKVISFGNASDLQCHDFLNYLAQDEKTRIIGGYLEGLKDGDAFYQAAKKITPRKPIVIWKGGQTEGGSRATQSHTASIAGSADIWRALCRQAGIISVDSQEELITTISALQRLALPGGTKVAVLGGAGGGSVTMTDEAERQGLQVPKLSEKTIKTLEEFVPLQGNIVSNPLDIMGALVFSQLSSPNAGKSIDNFLRLFQLLGDDPKIDALIFFQRMEMPARTGGRALIDLFMEKTCDGAKIMGKPVFIVLEKGHTLDQEAVRGDAQEFYKNRGYATFPSFSAAARALYNMNQYRKYLDALGVRKAEK
ncbi:MAG: CoA-binding protein [Deltaproteobacteria bacterium]|nr:CoA-binding protein [Deltaproteobacteria bacterium]